jgi:hypothetical protein
VRDEAVGEDYSSEQPGASAAAGQTGGWPADGAAVEGQDPGGVAIVWKSGEELGGAARGYEFYSYNLMIQQRFCDLKPLQKNQ